jgi:hypothetical protein
MNLILSLFAVLYLSFNFNQGALIELSDGSTWSVSPNDIPKTALWLTPMPIEIEKSSDPDYSYTLNNLQLKQKVLANKNN